MVELVERRRKMHTQGQIWAGYGPYIAYIKATYRKGSTKYSTHEGQRGVDFVLTTRLWRGDSIRNFTIWFESVIVIGQMDDRLLGQTHITSHLVEVVRFNQSLRFCPNSVDNDQPDMTTMHTWPMKLTTNESAKIIIRRACNNVWFVDRRPSLPRCNSKIDKRESMTHNDAASCTQKQWKSCI